MQYIPIPEHAVFKPHLQTPKSQVSAFCSEHDGFPPHPHFPVVQVSESDVQCILWKHSDVIEIVYNFGNTR